MAKKLGKRYAEAEEMYLNLLQDVQNSRRLLNRLVYNWMKL